MKKVCGFTFLIIFIFILTGYMNHQVAGIEFYDFEFYPPTQTETWYQKNWEGNSSSPKWRVANIFSSPDPNSEKLGELVSFFEKDEYMQLVWQFRNQQDHVKQELRNLGDWGYGLHIVVEDTTRNFVRLANQIYGRQAWMCFNDKTKPEHITGRFSSFVGNLVRIRKPVKVIQVKEQIEVQLESGIYKIESLDNGVYRIRFEIPEDMPCGQQFEPTDMKNLEYYLLNVTSLKTVKGEFLISLAYQRGC